MPLRPEQLDKRLNWPLGRAERLARRRKLPHIVLPDGAIRFSWREIKPLIVRVAGGGAVAK
jgi:hypothetical protein